MSVGTLSIDCSFGRRSKQPEDKCPHLGKTFTPDFTAMGRPGLWFDRPSCFSPYHKALREMSKSSAF